jgi:hypothetical protein
MVQNDRNQSSISTEKLSVDTNQLVEYELVTLNYRPPELLLPEFEDDYNIDEDEEDEDSYYNEKIDEWSLACTIFENITGKIAFPGTSYEEVEIEHLKYRKFKKHEDKYWENPKKYASLRCWIPRLKDWFDKKCEDKEVPFNSVYEYYKIFVQMIKSLLDFDPEKRISAFNLLQYLEKCQRDSNNRFITIPSKETSKIQKDIEKREKLIQNYNVSFYVWWNRLCNHVSKHEWSMQTRTKIYSILTLLISIWKKIGKNTNVFYVAVANWAYWLMIIRKEINDSNSISKKSKRIGKYSVDERYFNNSITKYSILAPLKMSFEYFGIDQTSFNDILFKLGIRNHNSKDMENFWEKCDPIMIRILQQSNAMIWFPSPYNDSRGWNSKIDDVLCKKLKSAFISTKTDISHKTVTLENSSHIDITDDQFRYETSLLPNLLSKKNRNKTY